MRTVYLNDICNFEKGSTGLAKAIPGKYPLVATGADRRSCDSFQLDTKAVCIPLVSSTGHGHASLKNVHYQEGKFALGSILVALTAKNEDILNIQFLHLYLSELKDKILVPLMSGAANVALSVTKIKSVEIPLPSINRQKEIVINFKSIVAEENELKTELTHQQTLLKKLRQQILQEAIEGKLTQDWRADNPDVEPASELLNRIQAEKQQLIKDKKIKKQKLLSPINEEEKPFELPNGWVWCRGEEVADFIDPQPSHRTPPVSKDGIPYVAMKDIFASGKINFYSARKVSKKILKEHNERYELNIGDFIIGKIGTLGNPVWLTKPFNYTLSANIVLVQPKKIFILPKYIFYLLKSPYTEMHMIQSKSEMSYPVFGIKKMRLMPVILPSLPEQKATVTKVEKLLSLCDQLETQITDNQSHAEQLMQSVLKEAFSQAQKFCSEDTNYL